MISNLYNLLNDTLIINLDERNDRYNRISQHLNQIGFNNRFNRYSAIKRCYDKLTPQQNGHLGCILSHCNIIEGAHNNKHEYVLILEDDCEFISDNTKCYDFLKLSHTLSTLQFDFVYLGATYYHLNTTQFSFLDTVKPYGCNATFAMIVNVESVFSKWSKVYESEDAIVESVIKNRGDVSKTTIDGIYNSLNLIRYATNPILATQHACYSNIEQTNVSYPLEEMWKVAKSKI